MRSFRNVLLAVLALGVALAGVWWSRRAPDVRAATVIGGQLELAAGDVKVERAGVVESTVSGMPLSDGAQITTGKGARALVRLAGGGSAFVGQATQLKLAGPGVSLETGRVWLDIPSLPQPVVHQLGSATVAVGNAGLSVERKDDAIEVYVARGLAVVAADKGRREVAAGERAKVAKDGSVTIEPVSFWDDWTGGMADRGVNESLAGSGSGKIYAVDRNAASGTAARPLEIKRQAVRSRIDDGIAETEVDQTFWNPSDRVVEGYYWFTVPPNALVTGFALETNGTLIEGEVVERKEAAAKYEAAVQRANDPALLEWINGRNYRARIFPIPGLGSRRVVLRYVETVALGDGRIRWVYPLAQGHKDTTTIDEFSLALDLSALGETTIATLPDARVEQGGKLITMRRSVYSPRADFQVEVVPKKAVAPLRSTRFKAPMDQADFVMLRWVPDMDWGATPTTTADIVLALDVSAGGDDADRQLKFAVAEATLRNLAAGDHFAVMTTDVQPRVVYPETGLAPAEPEHVAKALEKLASVVAGGATDLGAMFDPGLSRLHAADQPALIYVGDGVATSGELGGADVVERLRRSLEGARARFFSIGVGSDANHSLLERLAAVGGGQHFVVDNDERAVREALQLTAAIKTPTITDLELDVGVGLDEPLSNVSGKLVHGQELVLLARTHHDLPKTATIRGRLGGKSFTRSYDLKLERGAATTLVPKLWAAEFARRLMGRTANPDDARGKIVSLSMEYGLVTPYSSILALDSEAAYQQMGIPRSHRPWDRLPRQQASLTDVSSGNDVFASALALSLAPITLLAGCDREPQETVTSASAPMRISANAEEAKAARDEAPPSPPADMEMVPGAAPEAVGNDPMSAIGALMGDDVRQDFGAGGLGMRGYGRGGGGSNDGASLSGLATAAAEQMPRRTATSSVARAPRPQPARPQPASPSAERTRPNVLAYVQMRYCSDLAARPLTDRAVMWARRLRSVTQMHEALRLYDAARSSCEITGQRDQRVLLGQLVRFATNGGAAEQLFAHFNHDPDAVALLARHVLRRTLDPYVAAVARRMTHGGDLDWVSIDLELAALPSHEKRIERLRTLLLGTTNNVDGELRLMRFLLRDGKRDEALALGARLRQRGLFSPLLLRDLGDLQVEAGLNDAALRTYTEIVEFDPQSPDARRLVGDTLLKNGWYDVAYRQYRTLVDMTPGDATSEIRQAVAAAGVGRTDEALRILRHVAESDAEPGDRDPRLYARLLASSLLGRLLEESKGNQQRTEAVTRQLKQLQLLPTAGRLCILTWDAFDVSLGLGVVSGEVTDAEGLGLLGVSGCQQDPATLISKVVVRTQRPNDQPIAYKLHELTYDGKAFSVTVTNGKTL